MWRIQEEIFSKWLRWEIKGQRDSPPTLADEGTPMKRRRRGESEADSPPPMPLLPWRALQVCMSDDTAFIISITATLPNPLSDSIWRSKRGEWNEV